MDFAGALLIALLFAGFLAYGIVTGTMPGQAIDIERTKRPVLFWLLGGCYAGMAILVLAIGVQTQWP